MKTKIIIAAVFLLTATNTIAQKMVKIESGKFLPLYGTENEVQVEGFLLDVYPVTNQEFVEFVKQNPRWQKTEIKRIFADENYLKDWKTDTILGAEMLSNSPITNISWFAAKTFCQCKGKRLPTIDEWEYAAMASENLRDAREQEAYNKMILSWYETPNTYKKEIGKSQANYWGVHDLFGLVWEWTADFNSVILTNAKSDNEDLLFCGTAEVGVAEMMNYAAMMRYALRESTKGNYAIKNLGFRCAKNL